MPLPEKWLSVDPGEDTGYAVWSGEEFIDHGTEKMWTFSDAVWREAMRQIVPDFDATLEGMPEYEPTDVEKNLRDIQHVVVENWSLYPWVVRTGAMDWDECRTARLIGSIFAACRMAGWPYEQQPAKIKERAVAAGAENFFSHPLHENRHQNDATMHGFYRIAKERGASFSDE